MTSLVFGVGIGTFIVVTLVIVSFILCCVSLRTRSNVGPIFIVFASIVLTVLLLIPRGPDSTYVAAQKSEYPLFIWRLCLLCLLAISSLGGFIFLIFDSLTSINRPKLLKL